MIDEKRLIKEIAYLCEVIENNVQDVTENYTHKTLNEIINFIEEQPKVGDWIPVSENPKKNDDYLVTCRAVYLGEVKHDYVGVCSYIDGEWQIENTDTCTECITAWQPLPEPYKEVE